MAELSKKQLAWRPGQTKVRRSTMVMFSSVTLVLEALVVLFAGLAMFGLHNKTEGKGLQLLIASAVLAVLLILACAVLGKSWGMALGWGLQVVLILMGFFEPMMFLVGALFMLVWAYGAIQGGKIDRENARRAREQAEWEAANPA